MAHAYPTLGIGSYDEAMPFYLEFLGFRVDFEHRRDAGSPVYMGISRGVSPGIDRGFLALHLTEHAVPLGAAVLLDVERVHDLYHDLRAKDPALAAELVDKPWGKSELHLHDPFGNHLTFTSPTP